MNEVLDDKINSALFRTAELTLRVSSLEKLLTEAGTFTDKQLNDMNQKFVNQFKDLIEKELEIKKNELTAIPVAREGKNYETEEKIS